MGMGGSGVDSCVNQDDYCWNDSDCTALLEAGDDRTTTDSNGMSVQYKVPNYSDCMSNTLCNDRYTCFNTLYPDIFDGTSGSGTGGGSGGGEVIYMGTYTCDTFGDYFASTSGESMETLCTAEVSDGYSVRE